MVGDHRFVAAFVTDHEAGHQTKEVGDVARPGGIDHFPVDHGDGTRGLSCGLRQAGQRQDHGHVLVDVLLSDRRGGLGSAYRPGQAEHQEAGVQGAARKGVTGV